MSPTKRVQTIANFLDHEGPLSIRELSAKIYVDQTTVYFDLMRMETEGRVEREPIEGRIFQAVKPKHSLYRWRLIA